MKATTLIKVYHVLEEEGYKPIVTLTEFKPKYAWLEMMYIDNNKIHKVLFSKLYTKRYLLMKLNGIKFGNRKVKH